MFKKKKVKRRKMLNRIRNEMLSGAAVSAVQEIKGGGKMKRELGTENELNIVEEELNIKKETQIADSLLMQLEDEVIGFINRRLEEHVSKRIKGVLLPIAKLFLKMQKLRPKFSGEPAGYFLDLEDDLKYILENSKLRQISPQVGEKFNPVLHEEVDFAWDPQRNESEILATVRDGFFWQYNQEMIIKPQVVVNRRLAI